MEREFHHPRGMLVHGYKAKEHPSYNSWSAMRGRCDNPNFYAYDRYGGRGISYCERWIQFINFANDMGPRPEGMTLERKDNNGNYNLENCVWATYTQQNHNQRIRKDNKTGVVGVKSLKDGGFTATYTDSGNCYCLGNFNTVVEATKQRAKFILLYTNNNPQCYDLCTKGKSSARVRRDSRTGVKGIYIEKQGFLVYRVINGKWKRYKSAKTFEEAIRLLGETI